MPLVLCVIVYSFTARAQDGGVQSDAPRIVKLRDDSYLVNKAAFVKLDDEMKRLQGVERLHKEESWVQTVMVSLAVGAAVGATTVGVIWWASSSAAAANKPSP